MRQSSVQRLGKDRRSHERLPTSLRGKAFPGPLDCVIVNFTKHGACLRFDEPPAVGDQLIIVVWSSGVAFEAKVRWRSGDEVGVEFHSSRDLRRPAPPHLAEVQALWQKRRPRIGRRALKKNAVILDKRARRTGWASSRPTQEL